MFKKTIVLFSLCLTIFLLYPLSADAKKLLPRAGKTASVKSSKTSGVNVSVKFRADRLGIIITFANLSIASSVSYELTYNTGGTTQAVGGAIALPSEDPTVREIIFGSCSRNVCRYDTGITNAKFKVTTTLKSGKKVVKSFRLKV